MVAPANPGSILFGRTRQAILALTFLRPDESFYLREIVRRTGCGTGSVQRELKLLTECGILRRDRQRFFQANPKSPIYEPLKQLVIRTVGLGERLRNVLQPIAGQIAVAFIFGSFARGEPHETSDVDLLIVSRDDQFTLEQVTNLFRNEQEEIGREINPFLLTAEEWRTKFNARNPFIRRVESGEKLFLIGDQDELSGLAKERVAKTSYSNSARGVRPSRTGRSRSQKRKGKGARR